MHEVTMRMSDEAFDSISHNPDVYIVKDNKIADTDEFVIDVEHCMDTLKRIEEGDMSDFKTITDIDRHMAKLEQEIAKL